MRDGVLVSEVRVRGPLADYVRGVRRVKAGRYKPSDSLIAFREAL